MVKPILTDKVEDAIRELSLERDRLLSRELVISPARRESLRNSVAGATHFSFASLRLPASAALLAACVMFAASVLHFGETQAQSPNGATIDAAANSSEFAGSRAHFDLRVSPTELASLQSSFLALDRFALTDVADDPIRIRLDLPIRYEP